MNYYDRIQPRCLPPEAYLRLWESAAKSSDLPKLKSTVYPKDKPQPKEVKK